ncbi:MAG: hypothetical protein GX162_06870 [Firmicutes bacterium]|nr:hypothetical protein [Bacillota bacterium]
MRASFSPPARQTCRAHEKEPEGLYELALVAEMSSDPQVNWFKLTVLPGYFGPEELQIALAELTGLHDQ